MYYFSVPYNIQKYILLLKSQQNNNGYKNMYNKLYVSYMHFSTTYIIYYVIIYAKNLKTL